MPGLIRAIAASCLILTCAQAEASVSVTVNGTSYTIPQKNEKGWGDNVTAWIQAISSNTLYPTGGLFSLSGELDLGPNFGLKSVYFKSRTTSPASSGVLRLANADSIAFRNSGNSADLLLTPATDGILNYNGVAIDTVSATQTLTNKTLTSPVIASITNTGTLTLPSSTDTLVGRATTDTLTNKTISGSGNTLSNIPNSATTATNLNTASAIVARDASGNFTAGTITASLTGTASGNIPTSLLTTKGDLHTFSTVNARQAVGADGTVLSADSTQTTGLRWISPLTNPMTTAADLIIGGASGVTTRLANGTSGQVLQSNGGTSAETWSTLPGNSTALKAPTVQKFLTGSGTYTTPTSPAPLYIKVRMVGGGGGGGGGGTTTGLAATAGGNTTFGTSLLVANGGSLGSHGFVNGTGGAGGSASLGTGPVGLALSGATGFAGGNYINATGAINGGAGAASCFGGAGAPVYANNGGAAVTNSGSGGAGGGGTESAGTNSQPGGGGGAGGFVDAIITSPAATYAYAVGSGGSGGAGGTNGQSGGVGGSGVIIVEEVYQ